MNRGMVITVMEAPSMNMPRMNTTSCMQMMIVSGDTGMVISASLIQCEIPVEPIRAPRQVPPARSHMTIPFTFAVMSMASFRFFHVNFL